MQLLTAYAHVNDTPCAQAALDRVRSGQPVGWVERLRRRVNTASLQQYAPLL